MDVRLHNAESINSSRHIPSWLFLAASAGSVNGFAFLLCQQFVTHVSGTVTRLGLELPRYGIAAEYGAVVGCFVIGAAISVVTIQARAWRGQQPRWAATLSMVSAILIVVAFSGHWGAFGRFESTLASDPPPVVLLSLLAFAMGLQNAVVATATGLAVRTTHMTGPATDLGISLGTAILTHGAERSAAVRGIILRGGKILAFIFGAGLMVPLSRELGYLSLTVPATFIFASAMRSFTTSWQTAEIAPAVS